MQRTVLKGGGGYRQAFFKDKGQFNVRQIPKRRVLQGAINKPKIASPMRIVDPPIRSLEVEARPRVSQKRFHAMAMLPIQKDCSQWVYTLDQNPLS